MKLIVRFTEVGICIQLDARFLRLGCTVGHKVIPQYWKVSD